MFLLFRAVFDVFRSQDLRGLAKAAWLVFVIALPYLGVFVDIIARGDGMTQRDIERARANEAAMQDYIRSTMGSSSGTADELAKLAELQSKGVPSEAEFEEQKAKLPS